MLILNGGDSMEVKLISNSNEGNFEEQLRECLSDLVEQHKEVIDIKYQTESYVHNNRSRIEHSALVIYK